jgi:hypothetical protein
MKRDILFDNPDFGLLFEALVDSACDQLGERGTFPPFGASASRRGEVALAGGLTGDSCAPPEELISALRYGLGQAALRGEIRAAAVCSQVLITPPGLLEEVEAIRVELDCQGGEPFAVFQPYEVEPTGEVLLGDALATPASLRIFRTLSPIERLNDGIYLENARVLLPWGASRGQLLKSVPPGTLQRSGDRLTAPSPLLLGGIQGEMIEVSLTPANRLEQACVWLETGYSDERAEKTFEKTRRHLNRLLEGKARPIWDAPLYDKIFTWETGAVSISLMLHLGPEFGDYSYACQLYLEYHPEVRENIDLSDLN